MQRVKYAAAAAIAGLAVFVARAQADDPATGQEVSQPAAAPIQPASAQTEPKKFPEPPGAQRLAKDYDVWVDPKEGVVIVDGRICLREGMLEMFACTRNTKEHEAIVSVNSKAYLVHAGLMAVGAVPGHPVQWVPQYRPPAGTEIDVVVEWLDDKGEKKTARAQDWIKDIKTGKAMTYPFVFGGSRFWTDPETGKKYYQAEQGDFICVSNFGTAMLDIPVESSAENEELAFQTLSELIPPLRTPVRIVLKPKKERAAEKAVGAVRSEAGGSASPRSPQVEYQTQR